MDILVGSDTRITCRTAEKLLVGSFIHPGESEERATNLIGLTIKKNEDKPYLTNLTSILRNGHVRLISPTPDMIYLTFPPTFHFFSNTKLTFEKDRRDSEMASTSAVLLVMPLTQNRSSSSAKTIAFLKPLPLKPSKASSSSTLAMPSRRFHVTASNVKMEKAVSGLAAAALTVSMVIPEVAEAAGSGISPSLKNFLLSIAAGGVVLTVIIGVVVGVSNFDPVKRG
ncbi:hypothetical protein EUTSA_v10003467mg [Eutrema salsugineum]|uniref:Photosystem II reaction center X protein n=3 Tax=Brassicaceae TaxID=3700 RepID=V4LXD6_EUTSA|nr:hypothetical protein EUTSA_v10003467mg [Eutrema salsugineum]